MDDRIFGEIEDYPEGSIFVSREELSLSGIHRPTQAGISGSQISGADSIVMSGGYDDKDLGDVIIYTGHGGRDENTGEIISDQELSRQNLALALSKDTGYPVRVVRGAKLKSPYAPGEGYRYDGLYLVEDYWEDKVNNFTVLRFKLTKVPDKSVPPPNIQFQFSEKENQPQLTGVNQRGTADRRLFQTYRIIRDTRKSLEVKKLYDYHCQICNTRLESVNGPYAEAAHIKPLGNPHNGPDDQDNIICLCPNHHVLFDNYAFTINDDLSLAGIKGNLIIKSNHRLNEAYLAYRRNHYKIHTVNKP